MDKTNLLAGTATLQINGDSYALRGNFAYMCSGFNRTTIEGQDQVHGYGQKPKAGGIYMDLTDTGGLSVNALNAMTNVTITAQLANGKTVVAQGAWQVGDPPKADSEDAKITIEFASASVTDYVS